MVRRVEDTLARINARAEQRLNGLANYFPQPKAPSIPFEEYLPRAMAYAQQDEKFARELARTMYQAQRMGG